MTDHSQVESPALERAVNHLRDHGLGRDWSREEILDLIRSAGLVAIDPALVERVSKAQADAEAAIEIGEVNAACGRLNEARLDIADAVIAQIGETK